MQLRYNLTLAFQVSPFNFGSWAATCKEYNLSCATSVHGRASQCMKVIMTSAKKMFRFPFLSISRQQAMAARCYFKAWLHHSIHSR